MYVVLNTTGGRGPEVHGPFDDFDRATQWAIVNLVGHCWDVLEVIQAHC